MVLQRALAVVRQHQHLDPGQQPFHLGQQRGGIGVERLLEIHAQQLLMATHHPQLDDGGLVIDALEMRLHTGSREAVSQALTRLVLAGHTHQRRGRPQRCDVQRDVGRTAWAIFDLLDLHHRHRCLGRNPRRTAMPVTIEHDVTDHQNGGLVETGHGQLHWGSDD